MSVKLHYTYTPKQNKKWQTDGQKCTEKKERNGRREGKKYKRRIVFSWNINEMKE